MAVILQASSTKPDKTALGGLCFELQFKAIEFPWLHLVCSPSETQVKRCCQEASPGKERKVVQGDRLRSTPEVRAHMNYCFLNHLWYLRWTSFKKAGCRETPWWFCSASATLSENTWWLPIPAQNTSTCENIIEENDTEQNSFWHWER